MLRQYTANQCTSEELLELLAMAERADDHAQFEEAAAQILQEVSTADPLPGLDKDKIFAHIISKKPVHRTAPLRKWTAYAAAVLLAGCAAALYLADRTPYASPVTAPITRTVMMTGGNKAVLTLANGKQLRLNERQKGTLATQNQVPVQQVGASAIAYQPAITAAAAKAAYNTLSIPAGSQYSITLTDGTKVWLNALSSLTYPVNFTGKQRKVVLKGEGYFEVAPDKNSAFVVMVNQSEVKVYGTHFNVSGYSADHQTRVTLLEGSVKMTSEGNSKMLIPGQQATVKNGQMTIKPVAAAAAVAWKEGKFSFAHERIEDIMRKLERWYDIQVHYQGDITTEGFVGTVPRSEDLREVLNTLSLTGLVHFKVEGRSVTVMP